MQAIPLSGNFGARIEEIDLTSIAETDFEKVYRLWLEHKVLVFRSQTMTDDQLEAFSARFGDLDTIPYFSKLNVSEKEFKSQGYSSIYILPISNISEDGRSIGALGDGEVHWHSDTNYMRNPCAGMVLLGETIPPAGGDTHFADQERAYHALPDTLKEQISSLCIKHDASHTSDGNVRPGFEEFASASLADLPGEKHPIVYEHPETGRTSLFLGRRAYAYIDGLSLRESEALLDQLWDHAIRPEHVITHQWQRGDVVVWDNRNLMHHRGPFEGSRYLKRCQINSSRPGNSA